MLPIHNNAPASGALSDPVAMVDWQLGSRRRSWAIQSGDQDYQFRLYHSLQGTRGLLDVDLKSKGYLQLGWLTPQFQFGSLYQLSRGIRWSSHLDQLASHQARASAQIPVLSPSRLFLTNQSGQAIAAQGVFLSPGIYNIHSIDAARFGTLHAHLLDQQGNIQSYSMPWHRHPQLLAGESFARPLRSSSHSAIRGRKSKLGIRDGMALRTILVLDRGKVLDYTESIATMDFSGGRCHR